MRADVTIAYRTRSGINEWRGTVQGQDLRIISADCVRRLKRRLRGRVTRIDWINVRRMGA